MSDREYDMFLCGIIVGAVTGLLIGFAVMVVGDRALSPSPGVPHATATPRADSETAPARPPAATTEAVSVGGGGEDVVPLEEAQASVPVLAALPAGPASTVVVQALTSTPVVTAVATAWPVVTQAVESSGSALIAASPWPAHLHATVACLVQRESGWKAGAVGAAGEIGWMQIGPANFAYLAGYGIASSMLSDPATNLRAGWLIYLYWQQVTGDGFAAWTTRGWCA